MITKSIPILVVGAIDNNPTIYTYASSFYTTFVRMGYQNTTFFNLRQSFIPLVGYASLMQLPGPLQQLNNHLLNKALIAYVRRNKPSLIFCIKAHTLFPETLIELKKYGNPLLIHFYPDNPFVCWNGNSNQRVLEALPLFDTFLIWSEMLMQPLLSAGCTNVQYFPFAFDAHLFNQAITITVADRALYQSDISFIGTWDQERAQWLEALAHRCPSRTIAIWGNMWLQKLSVRSPLRQCYRGPAMYGSAMIKALRLSAVNLNFIRTQNATSHNMRTLEIPASKAFMLTQRTEEQARKLFTEGKNIVCFESLDELEEKVVRYLGRQEERAIITQLAWEHAQNYTLEDQLTTLLGLLDKQKT